ncbi:MAG: glycosyltransferase family 4 protein [Armatimonadetes bacterium]|nr:glycosyltransferase family 4 protein [Armatimonadota bacterium]
MRTLLLIPSVLKTDIEGAVAADRHPRMDYHALAEALREGSDDAADLLDYAAADGSRHPLVRLAARIGGRDAALATLGWLQRGKYDAIFTNGENVALPLALLLKLCLRRPGHVTIGHRLSAGKKRPFYTLLGAHRQMDTIFVYAQTQRDFAESHLHIPPAKLSLIPFHADQRFYRPQRAAIVRENQLCAAGREWRDYPALLAAMERLPDMTLKMTTASPWSKSHDRTADLPLPPNVSVRRYEYSELRDLYSSSVAVCVPLLENDFSAGVTTLLEAMATGTPVIVTRTEGLAGVITDGENGLTVAPGDTAGWHTAIVRLRDDDALRERLAHGGRCWLERHATLDLWTQRVAAALRRAAAPATDPSPASGRISKIL